METKKMNKSAAEVVARLAAQAIDEKKGENVVLLDLREITTAPAQWFVIASGNVPSHVSALADAVYEVVKKATGEMPKKVEGYDNAEWVLLDYFDVVVHVFQKDKREYYRLDELWADGKRVEFGEKK
ncbi:MAG: ribosome silencing factor [Bacteroidales bacterium]|jgi:ribosome-associated protein|nr:ribosome silencing factor [Bacteroidales bacterium]